MDEDSPNRHPLNVELEIKRCRDRVAELSPIIREFESERDQRHSLNGFNPQNVAPPSGRFNPRLRNHEQTISEYNKLMVELETLSRRAISHPIHRLPEELLERIFHLLLETTFELEESEPEEFAPEEFAPEESAPETFPLNLTQVCRKWKALVLSRRNRRLWSTVQIDPADPDWLGRLHVYLCLSRDEGLNIIVTGMTQGIVGELAVHYRRIRSWLPGTTKYEIWNSTTSEPDTIQLIIKNQFGQKPFSIPLSSSVTTLPFVELRLGSLHHLQPFRQLETLQIRTGTFALEGLGGPIQWPALQRLHLQPTQGNPVDYLRFFAPAQLLDLQLELLYQLSLPTYLELEAFIIGDMPKLRWLVLLLFLYTIPEFMQPVQESTAQSSSAKQSESLRRVVCRTERSGSIAPPFGRLIGSAPHLEECDLMTPMTSFPSFGHSIRELKLNFFDSPTSHLMNGELFKFVHLEVLKLTFVTIEQLQLLTLFQAPSLLSLRVLCYEKHHPKDHSIPLDVISTFISTSQEISDLLFRFPVNRMDLSLFELQNLKLAYVSHFLVLATLNVPKLQHLFLRIDDGSDEDGSIAGGQDLAENSIDIVLSPTSFQVVGTPSVPGLVKTTPVLESESEQRAMKTLEEDVLDGFNGTCIPKAPFDPLMTSPPTFSAITFEHLKVFEFEVSTTSNSHPPRVLPYFPDMLATLPALERITLPAVSFNDTPYVYQLVKKVSDIPTLCRNLQEIRTRDYPDDWSYFLTFLRNRKRASILSDPTLRPIHTVHFPITPHGSIVSQLQDAMLGKVATGSLAVPRPRPLLTNPSLVHGVLPWQEDIKSDAGEEMRPQDQGEDERPAAEPFQAQEADIQGNGDEERQPEEDSGSNESEDEAPSCFLCHKAGLGAGCRGVFWKGEILSRIEVSSGDVMCTRWDDIMDSSSRFESICLP